MVGKKVSSVFHTSQKVILSCECVLTIEHIVRHRVAASGEPMIPEVAQLLRMTPESDFIPPTVSQTWKNQHERDLCARQFLDHWQDSACWSGCGRIIDGLIM